MDHTHTITNLNKSGSIPAYDMSESTVFPERTPTAVDTTIIEPGSWDNPLDLTDFMLVHKYTKEEGTADKGKALKYDDNKVDWAILPLGAVEEIIKVMKFGESKYARGNFAEGTGLSYTRLLNALVRHTFAFMRGEDLDPESGLSHMAHAGCCVLFILHYIVNGDKYKSNDDRSSSILP